MRKFLSQLANPCSISVVARKFDKELLTKLVDLLSFHLTRSTTCRVDIFSLGCVYYYVLSGGSHPFGESFRRQANILSGECNLSKDLSDAGVDDQVVTKSLIYKMLKNDPNARPPTSAVLRHPVFWSVEKRYRTLFAL